MKSDIIPAVAGEKSFLLRLAPELFEQVRALSERHERSINWTIVRLLRWALLQPKGAQDDAMR